MDMVGKIWKRLTSTGLYFAFTLLHLPGHCCRYWGEDSLFILVLFITKWSNKRMIWLLNIESLNEYSSKCTFFYESKDWAGLLIRHHGATLYLFLGERLRRELSIMPFWSNPRALSDSINMIIESKDLTRFFCFVFGCCLFPHRLL